MHLDSDRFVCPLCPPSAARPASGTCANGCGRHVCVEHARAVNPARHGPMVCLECWERVYMSGRQELVGKSDQHVDNAEAWFRGMVDSGHLPAPQTRRASRAILLLAVVALFLAAIMMYVVIILAR